MPKSAYNITFNRLNSSKSTQWNSWSAGGRDSNNAYYADGAEYGHWDVVESDEEENYFHAGDIVYLDLTEFTSWENDGALMYINFTDATKIQNGGNDINIANANSLLYNPKTVDYEVEEHVYAYIVTKQDEGKDILRFWRGNSSTLWNYSIALSYEEFRTDKNCVKVTNWDNIGYTTKYVRYNNDYTLFSDKNEIVVGQDSEILYFYIDKVENMNGEIKLFEDGEQIGVFYDDGDYLYHGDDIKGDGIYSIRYILPDKSAYGNHTYYAKFGNNIITNEVNIQIIVPFDEKELFVMKSVNDKISEVLVENKTPKSLLEQPSEFIQNGDELNAYNEIYEKRIDELDIVLDYLLDEELILEYNFDSLNGIYNCKYSNGIPFVIITYDFFESNTYNNSLIYAGEDGSYAGYNTVILNAFEDSDYRTIFYEKLVNKWENEGMDVEYDDFVLVDDLKTKLLNRDVIVLCGHGMIMETQSVFCLQDEICDEVNNSKYTADIRDERIIPVMYEDGNQSYVITSDFFEHYYGDGDLAGSFVFSESCEFMGNVTSGFSTDFANAFLGCSAEAVVGFYNSVMADYSRELMVSYIENLLLGKTALAAFNTAKEKCGNSDYEYRKPSFWEYLLDRHAFEKMGNIAYPILVGNEEAIIIKEIRNGDFEHVVRILHPLFWKSEGDVRILTKLGELKPNGKRMAFISTGIGSKTGIGLSGTQGSTMSQIVRNTHNTKLQFNYDVLSEEPMEYVGSRFDDKFELQILDINNNILYSEIIESVNKSDWYTISDIDFDGGDSTMYHTEWKTKSIDVSEFQNQIIKIKFLVYDVGDSQYDTAVLIDDIKLS